MSLCYAIAWLFHFNPLVPSAHKSVRITKISILKLEGIIKKISYERRDNIHTIFYTYTALF